MPSVLITGAGRGIGRASALHLAAAGWEVYAGVRQAEAGSALLVEVGQGPGRIHPVVLDITSAADIAALAGQLPDRLDALVNNAGVVVSGPVEGLSLDELRRQLEVNVVAQVAVTQAVLPKLRTTQGRVVFISSISGRLSTPMTGAYNASKFALEGLADAMRMELRPWGVRVCLVEPAQTDTDLWRTAGAELDAAAAMLTAAHRQLYAKHLDGSRRMIPVSQRMATPAQGVAAVIELALTARRPRARYVVGRGPKVQAVLAGLTPTPVRDAVLSRLTGVPRRP
ncbi:MAG: SDR family NAD(P)-dependent oxidoreductase [Actinomycetota bacterium]|nr:SDR family NAD(P)-dependent oxidoreductase [Actinomycetota bacterium]